MRPTSLAALVLGSTLLWGCANPLPAPAPITRVSVDYDAAGNAVGVHAFIYGKRTVLAFDRQPLHLTVQDDNGVAVPYEREGQYYRLARQLDHFTVWTTTRVLSFARTNLPVAARLAKQAATASTAPTPTIQAPFADQAAPSLAQLFETQQNVLRQAIAAHASNSADAKAFTARLERLAAQHVSGAATTIYVPFATGATTAAHDQQLMRTLIPAALVAERINIEGHTDARTEGPDDLRIALERARAARQFLVAQGVDASKITIAARPAGDFLAPVETEQGRALNRRADIEFVHRREDH